MKISLVIRTLNEESNIDKCLSTVLLQTKLPDEVLIIDNGSNDKTIEIAEIYKNKLNLRIINNSDIGFSSGLNIGAKEANFELIAYLSADCFPNSDWLANLIASMNQYKADVVMGAEKVQGKTDIHFVLKRTRHLAKEDKKIIFFVNSNILYKKETLLKILPFVGIGNEKGGEDTLISIKFIENGYLAIKSAQAIVKHSVYENMDDFRARTIIQGLRLSDFFQHGWKYPRIYLNPFYWSLIEFLYFFRYFDVRFLRISYLRLKYILIGIFKSIKK